MQLSHSSRLTKHTADDEDGEGTKIKNEEDGAEADVDPDEVPPEEAIDDHYETDEDDMADDYNAEGYFDDGGDDGGDDYDAGNAGDEGYYD